MGLMQNKQFFDRASQISGNPPHIFAHFSRIVPDFDRTVQRRKIAR